MVGFVCPVLQAGGGRKRTDGQLLPDGCVRQGQLSRAIKVLSHTPSRIRIPNVLVSRKAASPRNPTPSSTLQASGPPKPPEAWSSHSG